MSDVLDNDLDNPATYPLDSLHGLSRDGDCKASSGWIVWATLVVVLVEAVVLAIATMRSGSAVLFAETAQTIAGAGVEVFLIVGVRRARRGPDDRHPMGYGREAFFWSLVASVGIFLGGGAVSIAQGLRSLGHENTGDAYTLGYVVLSVIVVADAITFFVALSPLRRSAIVGRIGLRRGLRHTSDATARTLVFDNAAAVLGGLIGIAGLAAHQVSGDARVDAYASLLIGALLLATTFALLRTNRELLTDRGVANAMLDAMRAHVELQAGIHACPDLVAVYTGPNAVLVTGTVVLDPDLDVRAVERALRDAGDALTRRWPGELRVYLAPVPCSTG